jgi:hypothetical protein
MTYAYQITEIGVSIIFIFCVIKLLDFYGFNLEDYAIYIAFYIFLLISKLVLPNEISAL